MFILTNWVGIITWTMHISVISCVSYLYISLLTVIVCFNMLCQCVNSRNAFSCILISLVICASWCHINNHSSYIVYGAFISGVLDCIVFILVCCVLRVLLTVTSFCLYLQEIKLLSFVINWEVVKLGVYFGKVSIYINPLTMLFHICCLPPDLTY